MQYANGYNKESVITQVKKYNNGKRASEYIEEVPYCMYQTPEGNRCFIGCFIPEGHPALNAYGGIGIILSCHPDLRAYMPFSAMDDLNAFQRVHDNHAESDLYDQLERFLSS